MKRSLYMASWLGSMVFCLFCLSCKKSSSSSGGASEKAQIVTGTWKQTDIVLGVPVSVNVQGNDYNFPAGTSMITDPYLTAFGVTSFFTPTTGNIYTFSDKGAYQIDGVTDVILPVAGNSGTWSMDVYDAVVKLTSATNVNDPHWIDGITSDSLALSLTVDIPGLGTAPLTLLLQKQ